MNNTGGSRKSGGEVESRHPGWLSGEEVVNKAVWRGVVAHIITYPLDLLERGLKRTILGAPRDVIVYGSMSLLESLSRNVVYKLRGHKRFAFDDVLIAGFSVMPPVYYFMSSRVLASPRLTPYIVALFGFTKANIEAAAALYHKNNNYQDQGSRN